MKSLGSKATNFPAAAKLARSLGRVVLVNGGCLGRGQNRRDMTLQTGRPVSKGEFMGAVKTKVLQGGHCSLDPETLEGL